MLKVKNKLLNVDILDELQQFEWKKGEVRGNKWLSCSPFRQEKNRSFAVNLSNGLYIDSGLEDDYWRAGNFPKLLSFLSGDTVEQMEEMLMEKYSAFRRNVDDLKLRMNLILPKKPSDCFVSEEIVKGYKHPNPYLLQYRGLNGDVLECFDVGYDEERNLSAFVWRDKDGNPINIKFRNNLNKQFFYLPNASPIKNHLYLIEDLYKKKSETVYITESEIDSLYIRSLDNKYCSVALGGAHMSRKQEQLLISSSARKIVICTDNDKAGQRIARDITQRLNGHKKIERIIIPSYAKDVNELPMEELRKVIETPVNIGFSLMV